MDKSTIIERLSYNGSPTKLAIYRILIGLLVLFICTSERSAMVDYINYTGVTSSALRTLAPGFLDAFSHHYILEIRFLLGICSVLFVLGAFYRYTSVFFFILLFLYYNGITSSIMLHGQWPYLWFIVFVMMFARASDVLSIDYLINKGRVSKNTNIYRWPVEIAVLWIVILYGWAGIAKLLPLHSFPLWLEGNTTKELVYSRYLFSPLFYNFGSPLFNYANGYNFIFSVLSYLTVIFELAAFIFLFTRKYAMVFILIIAVFHLGITLVGVGDFLLVFLITSFCLWDEKLFKKFDGRFIAS